ncbi:MAG: hypothetical protein WKG07_32610 [Hymenobacter sp.]
MLTDRDEGKVEKWLASALDEFAQLGWIYKPGDGTFAVMPSPEHLRDLYREDILKMETSYANLPSWKRYALPLSIQPFNGEFDLPRELRLQAQRQLHRLSGDSGVGKSMVADLPQLIFVGAGAYQSSTHGKGERPLRQAGANQWDRGGPQQRARLRLCERANRAG